MTLPPLILAPTTILAVIASSVAALGIGFWQRKRTARLSDLIPLRRDREAAVRTTAEFSATTVASTISLATVVMAYFELAGYFGPWLFWTVLTTSGGLMVVRFFAPRIQAKLLGFGHRIPTLHEFIGVEFGSRHLAMVAAAATSLGYLGAYAVELTVGSRLFTNLVPGVPEWIAVVVLAAIGFTYTAAGGFRAVVLTDRLQMVTIWVFVLTLLSYIAFTLSTSGTIASALSSLPASARTFGPRDGLAAFLVGVFFINVPSYVADISMWQRISSNVVPQDLRKGLARSAVSAGTSWGLIAIIAIVSPLIAPAIAGMHPVASLMAGIASSPSPLAGIVLFVAIAGLYAAMMSTASTQLVAVSHTVFEDVLTKDSHLTDDARADSSGMLQSARIVLVVSAIAAVGVVEGLSQLKFTIADFVFAIYGAQLALFPALVAALYVDSKALRASTRWAVSSIGFGFLAGWASAIGGKLMHADTLVFMSPVVSLGVATVLLAPRLATLRVRRRDEVA